MLGAVFVPWASHVNIMHVSVAARLGNPNSDQSRLNQHGDAEMVIYFV